MCNGLGYVAGFSIMQMTTYRLPFTQEELEATYSSPDAKGHKLSSNTYQALIIGLHEARLISTLLFGIA